MIFRRRLAIPLVLHAALACRSVGQDEVESIPEIPGIDLRDLYMDPLIRLEGIEYKHYFKIIRPLNLDPGQRVIAGEIQREYWVEYEADLLTRIREFAGTMPDWTERGYADALEARRAEGDVLRADRMLSDLEFFARLADLCTPEQRDAMPSVWLAWQRLLWRTGPRELPGGAVDLIDLVAAVGVDISREARETLRTYELQRIVALRDSEHAAMRYQDFYFRSEDIRSSIEAVPKEDVEARSRLEREMFDVLEEGAAINLPARRNLLALNERYVTMICQQVSVEDAGAIREGFLKAAYPQIYPDPASASVLYRTPAALPDLDPNQAETLAALQQRFEREHARMSDEMAKCAMRRRIHIMEAKPDRPRLVGNEAKAYMALGLQREELNAAQIALVRSVLSPEQATQLPEWDFAKSPPSRPWDQNWRRAHPDHPDNPDR